MAITRAEVEAVLVRRCGKLLTAAELDGTTVNGTNADLNDPIGAAIRECGGTVASVASVADSDLSAIAADDYNKLLDLAELRTLESIFGNLDLVDYNTGQRIERLGQIGERLEKRIEKKRQQIERSYGLGASTLQAGVITVPFAETTNG